MSESLVISMAPGLKGFVAPSDLLFAERTISFVTDWASLSQPGAIFHVESPDFVFSLFISDRSIHLRRNEGFLSLPTEQICRPRERLRVFVGWSFSSLFIDAGTSPENRIRQEAATLPVAVPVELARWARKQGLLPTESYDSLEVMRQRIHAALLSINEKIHEADAYRSFWNTTYEGNKIIARQPKRETEIQPLFHCMLADQMLMGNIEVEPEIKSGAGNLDFGLVANVLDLGLSRICAEFTESRIIE